MTDAELKEFNEFVQESPVRNKFLPVMEHLCKLIPGPEGFSIGEYAAKKTEETICIRFHINNRFEDGIEGRVGYDMFDYPAKKEMSYELWWGEECYCHLYRPIEMMNMIGILLGKVKIEDVDKYKAVRKSDCLFPITE
jgi:hypothetical protein